MLAATAFLAAALLSGTPAYEQYPSTSTFTAESVAPDLSSHPQARRYRTLLRRAAKHGANFAGCYAIVPIGCGTSCVQVAVLDTRSGAVWFPKGLQMVQWAGWWHDPYGIRYLLSSRLVAAFGKVNTENAPYGASYFVWTGEDFELAKFVRRDRGKAPE